MANKNNTGAKSKDAKKWKFNIIDVLVLVVVVLAAVLLFRRVATPATEDEEKIPLTYEPYVVEYYCDNSYKFVTDHLEVGAQIRDDTLRLNMGALLDYKLQPSVFWEMTDAGQMVQASRDDQNSVTLYTIVDAGDNGNGITTYDNQVLSLGHSIVLRVGVCKFYMTVANFTKLSESEYANMELPEYGHVDMD